MARRVDFYFLVLVPFLVSRELEEGEVHFSKCPETCSKCKTTVLVICLEKVCENSRFL